MRNKIEKRAEKVQTIGTALEQVIKMLDMEDNLLQVRVVAMWRDISGKILSHHSSAVRLKEGVLFIDVENAAWLQEISMLKKAILEKYKKKLGKQVVLDLFLRNKGIMTPVRTSDPLQSS